MPGARVEGRGPSHRPCTRYAKESLRGIQFSHFDHERRRLTIFTKGRRCEPSRMWKPSSGTTWVGTSSNWAPSRTTTCSGAATCDRTGTRAGEKFITEYRDQLMGVHGLHKWWYRCLQRARVVAEGVTRGRKMLMARHTAGQSVLDRTGNLKVVQKLLGHSSITTTGDIYTDWDIDQLEETMRFVVGEDNDFAANGRGGTRGGRD